MTWYDVKYILLLHYLQSRLSLRIVRAAVHAKKKKERDRGTEPRSTGDSRKDNRITVKPTLLEIMPSREIYSSSDGLTHRSWISQARCANNLDLISPQGFSLFCIYLYVWNGNLYTDYRYKRNYSFSVHKSIFASIKMDIKTSFFIWQTHTFKHSS